MISDGFLHFFESALTQFWGGATAVLKVPTHVAVSCFELRDSNVSKPKHTKATQGLPSALIMAVEHNTAPEDSPLLVAEAPKKSGRVVAAVAAALGAIARTDANGLKLKPGKQYNAGSIHVVDCNKDVSPQYQLTWWKGTCGGHSARISPPGIAARHAQCGAPRPGRAAKSACLRVSGY